jgi:hypothetical protein
LLPQLVYLKPEIINNRSCDSRDVLLKMSAVDALLQKFRPEDEQKLAPSQIITTLL